MTSDASETPAARQQRLQQRNNRKTIEHILVGAGSSTADKCVLQGTSFTCNAEQDSQPSDVWNTMDFLMQVAAWTQCERSSVAARCNVATTACVKALRSRATPSPSDVAGTHRPSAQSPLRSDRVMTSQRPPINLHRHHHEERSEEHLWQAPEEGEEEVCGPSVCGSDH
ncbi:hypothetical protein Pcinc_002949 [Petrolisthes cinctipes]|uniref:Uncharacterized protein n=1 Tax=Petrolisthes cinctipes TaxID=88211 RepID=A0AAE1GI97_PETCI|nr:hypothetical protein Pcinc_002949 [Petrolisthes cinctipes]